MKLFRMPPMIISYQVNLGVARCKRACVHSQRRGRGVILHPDLHKSAMISLGGVESTCLLVKGGLPYHVDFLEVSFNSP